MAGVYDTPDPIDRICGDFFLSCCCFTSPCAFCQQLRTVPASDWDCCAQLCGDTGFVCMENECKCISYKH